MTCEKYIAYFRRIFFINCYARYTIMMILIVKFETSLERYLVVRRRLLQTVYSVKNWYIYGEQKS